jgi:hypothetical protein
VGSYKQLRKFKPDDLVLNEEETRIILKFIFKPTDHEVIESLNITDQVRGFAQGLLVEAIDASYGVGYIKALFESTTNPSRGALKIIKAFGKKAAKHWFKHASVHDLRNVRIYDFVRDSLARSFRIKLKEFQYATRLSEPIGAFVAYQAPSQGAIKVWG